MLFHIKKEIHSNSKSPNHIFISNNTQHGGGLGKFHTHAMLVGKQFGEQIVSMY